VFHILSATGGARAHDEAAKAGADGSLCTGIAKDQDPRPKTQDQDQTQDPTQTQDPSSPLSAPSLSLHTKMRSAGR